MTQHEKIIKIMETSPNKWWAASDFMQPYLGELFVGYEASARLSELSKKGLIETKREGKFRFCKLIVEQEPTKSVPWLND